MSLGASEEWRVVLEVMTNETQLSAAALLEYFSPLESFLKNETARLNALRQEEMDQSAPIIVGVIIVSLTAMIIILYCVKKHKLENRISSFCAFRRNGSHDRETNIQMQSKTNDTEGGSEQKM
ncbi:Angiotensin-converting enzyme-related protein [Eumeta japonica]|uniref:Angiotensin-converting enzyme-related protein n=1 Tax=Eumeta variegata TaxID=151549 RepID=A0A4C1T3F4_EUMVA|nr:Angiotensin-converting enzyme-related protein [Eumeta japonica]